MWMLIAINAAMLVGLLVTLWRLHRVQTLLLVQNAGDRHRPPVSQSIEAADRHRQTPALPRRSALDEFPAESTLEKPVAVLRATRPRPSAGRAGDRLAPLGR